MRIINLLSEPTCITLKLDICFSYRTETFVRNRKWLNISWNCVIRQCFFTWSIGTKRGHSDSRMWWEDIIKIGLWGVCTEGNQDNQLSAENRHQSAPAYVAVRITSYHHFRCVFWDYTRGRPSANILYTVCSLHGDHLIQESLSWEDKRTTKFIRQYRQKTPRSGAIFTHALKKITSCIYVDFCYIMWYYPTKVQMFCYSVSYFKADENEFPNNAHDMLLYETLYSKW